MSDKVLDRLAELEHLQWIEWTKYMLGNLTEEKIAKWKRQIETDYKNLPDEEKWSDRRWARKALKIIANYKL